MGDIKGSIEKAIEYLSEHPDEARYTDTVATAVMEEGLRCRVDGPAGESLTTDMSKSVGGEESAPSPGWLFRAALASCDATLIAMRAAQLGVTLTRLEVVVDSESDDRGVLGTDPSVPSGPFSIRVRVDAAAAGAEPAQLRDIVEWGVDHCPVCDAAKRPVNVSLEMV
ncbi:MAG TPA: OsmC family protein [Actinomycetota bacterium]|nr:OsmC family protein [Actinomycetota bacterium]